jgi:putative transposase
MKQVKLSYYHYFKKKNDYSGHLWQGRFKHSIIDTDRYLFQCGKYIELNPVRAGIVSHPEEYSYSSYGYYANGRQDTLLTENRLYATLGPNLEQRQEQYRDFVIDRDIKKRLTNDRFIGTPEFVDKLETIWGTLYMKHNTPRRV